MIPSPKRERSERFSKSLDLVDRFARDCGLQSAGVGGARSSACGPEHDALNRRIATQEWAIWRPEVAWLTGYFSVAVWLSVSLVHFAQPKSAALGSRGASALGWAAVCSFAA
jgi:hypothetical protein